VQDALDELRRERGKHFDPAVVDAFMTLVDELDPLFVDADHEAAAGTRRPAAA
jgi:response regulator RpfG family c-di-GMP phosphodiesterase